MTNPVVSMQQWQAQRAALLVQEKAHTQERARLAKLRRELPWVEVQKNYEFNGAEGSLSLNELFGDRSQLIIYHLMFGDGWADPCIGCSQWADAMNGTTDQFERADACLIAVSRAPYEQLVPVQSQRGWQFTWVSSHGSDFNVDYHVSAEDLSEGATGQTGCELVEFDRGENHGVSVFARNDAGQVFHTYSVYNRGIEPLNGAMGYFDLLPNGRPW